MSQKKREKKELLLTSPPNCTLNNNKRNMVGISASMGIMVAKLTKIAILKKPRGEDKQGYTGLVTCYDCNKKMVT